MDALKIILAQTHKNVEILSPKVFQTSPIRKTCRWRWRCTWITIFPKELEKTDQVVTF